MQKKMFILLFILANFFIMSFPLAHAEPVIHVNPIPNLDNNFIKGADVSMIPELEAKGGNFYDNKTEEDALVILRNHGINWIRLRIWNNPYVNNEGVGGGNTDEAKALIMAERAKKLGMKVLLDFHYSDFWADPGKQNKPAAWKDDDAQKLSKDIYKFTAKVIKDFNDKNLTPDMVQIGNEINNGILWPEGKLDNADGYKNLANMLRAGLKAVHDNDENHTIKTMIHLAGCDDAFYRNFFDLLINENKVNDFDIIGMSFYPFWHGKMDTLEATMNDITARYNKDVIVVETAFGFTNENGDSQKNVYGADEEKIGGYMSTVQGQASGIRDVMATVANVKNKRGLGIFYWEPDWIPVKGAGWKTGEGDEWDNLAMFDFKGNSLASIDVFNLVSDVNNKYIEPVLKTAKEVTVTGGMGVPVELPNTVDAIYSDDSVREVPVTWENAAPVFSAQGNYEIAGKIVNSDVKVSATIHIINKTNLVKNGNFETGTLSGWDISGMKDAVKNIGTTGDARDKSAMHYWAADAFSFTASQKINNLKDGKYTLACWTQGGGNTKNYTMFVKTDAGQKSVDIKDSGWNKWHQAIIQDIEVKGGTAEIGVQLDGNPGNWGSIDDVEFYLEQ